MTLTIIDKFGKTKVIKETVFIPRRGDMVR